MIAQRSRSARHRQQTPPDRDWIALLETVARTTISVGCQAGSWAARKTRRMATAISREFRVVKGRPVVTTRVIWVIWAASFITTGNPFHDWYSILTSLARFGMSAILLARWWRHNGQSYWRTTRGRMTEPVQGGSDAVIAALAEELRTTVAASNARIESLTAAIAEAFRAAGREIPDELAPEVTTGPLMKLIQGGRSDVAG